MSILNLKKILRFIGLPIYKFYAYDIKWRRKCHIDFSAYVAKQSSFEGMNRVHAHSVFIGSLGFGSYIGTRCSISAEIGRFTSIASDVTCVSGRHPVGYPYATTSPLFFSLIPNRVRKGMTFATKELFEEHKYAVREKKLSVKIGSDCWIGQGAKLIEGITIGDGAIILAYAVVTKDVPPYAIVGGIPAKVIRYRFSPEDIAFFNKVQWWNQPLEWFKYHSELLNDVEALKDYFKAKEQRD